jgi:fructokinase
LFTRTNNLHHGGYAVDAVDTTGAGDAFAASMLAELAAQQFAWEDRAVLANVLARATAAGALATTRRGGMTSLPDRAAIDELMCR